MTTLTQTISAGLIACTTACASSQDIYRYEFNMVLIENNMFGSSHVGAFNTMPLGTTGTIYIEAEDTVVATDLNDRFYRVLDIGFTAGSFSVGGNSGSYPANNLGGSLAIGNESGGLGFPAHADYFLVPLLLEPGELANFSSLVLVDADFINGEHVLLDSTDLPNQMDINVIDAERRKFGVTSSQVNLTAIFELTGINTIVTPAPGASALLLTGAIAGLRRRR